jgi:hypothetical protein
MEQDAWRPMMADRVIAAVMALRAPGTAR